MANTVQLITLATRPLDADLVHAYIPGTTNPIVGQLKTAAGANLANPFTVAAAGGQDGWAVVLPEGVEADLYWAEGDLILGAKQGGARINNVGLFATSYASAKALVTNSFVNGTVLYVSGRTSLADGSEGQFYWDSSDLSLLVSSDPLFGLVIPPDSDPTGASGGWRRFEFTSIHVDWFGAVGDGIVDDTASITAAITAAGIGGILSFTATKTYLISSILTALSGQVWHGNGATIKRADEIVTTLTAPVSSGAYPNTISVFNTAGFYVGQSVTFASSTIPGDRNGSAGELKTWEIIAIGVGTVTLSQDPGVFLIKSYVAGDYFLTSGHMLIAGGVGSLNNTLLDLVFDGNKDNNTTWQRWEITSSIDIHSDYGRVENCKFINAAADAILGIGRGLRILHNNIMDSAGNGIHFGETVDALVSENYIDNYNIGGEPIGHSDGAVVASNEVRRTIISNNFICNGNGYPAVGSFGNEQNSDVMVTGNHIENTIKDGVQSRSCIEVHSTTTTVTGVEHQFRSGVTNNTIINSGYVGLFGALPTFSGGDPSEGTFNIPVSGNYFEKTGLLIDGWGFAVTGNTFFRCPPVEQLPGDGLILWAGNATLVVSTRTAGGMAITGNTFTDTDDTGNSAIAIGAANNLLIANNLVNNFAQAIFYLNVGARVAAHNRITGNQFFNQTQSAIEFHPDHPTFLGGEGIAISGNTFQGGPGSIQTNNVIRFLGHGAVVSDNIFDYEFTSPSNNWTIITDSDGPGAFIKNNVFRLIVTAPADESFAVQSGNSGDFVEYNYSTDTAPSFGTFRNLAGAAFTNNRLYTL